MSQCGACGQSGVPLKKCARCQAVAYCSVECQRSAWPSHKAQCNAIGGQSQQASSSAAAAGGFRMQPTPGQFSNDPQMADLQRQLLARIMGEQMAAAGGKEAMEKDPEAFKRAMQQRVREQMIAAGINPTEVVESMKKEQTSAASAGSSSGVRRRGGAGPAPKNPFTGEEVDRNLGKHEMPFGMPGTYYGPGEDGEDHSGHDHGGAHGHSHGPDGQCNHDHGHGGEHGHSHGEHSHDHGHGHNHGEHGHDHGDHGHSHGEDGQCNHDHSGHNHGDHGHSHGDHAGHNHSHGGDAEHNHGHNHSHGDAEHAEHNHGHNHGHHNHGHEHNHGDSSEEHAGHNHGEHGHSHGPDGQCNHDHGHGGHNHSHDGDGDHAGHNHSHGGDHSGHNHGSHAGHNHGRQGGKDAQGPVADATQQKFGNKHRNVASGPRGAGTVSTEDSPAAQAAHVYAQPSLQLLTEGVAEGLAELHPHVQVGPARLVDASTNARAYQLLYASVAAKRPVVPGLPVATPSSLTFLPLTAGESLDLTEQDLAERTGTCHLCIMANSPFPTKTPTREDIQMRQALINNHVRVGKGLEQSFETKEIVIANPPLAGMPAEASQESLAPDCSIEMHSFQVKMKYYNPLDKQYSCTPASTAAASTTAAAAPITGGQVEEFSIDPARVSVLQSTFGLGPSKSTLKKAKQKAKKAAQAAAAATAPAAGGFLSSITSMFTGSSPAASAAPKDDEEDEDEETPAPALTAAEEEDSKDDGSSGPKKSKSKKAKELREEASMTIVQVLVRCAPPPPSGDVFEVAMSNRDPLRMYRFEFASPTVSVPGTNAPSPAPLLAAYQAALDFVLTFLHRTHPCPQPTAAQRAAFTVKDAQGNLKPAPMPGRMFPSHLALWVDRPEWTGIPRTPFVPKKLPGQEATEEQTSQALLPLNAPKINHNLFFSTEKPLSYAESRALAQQEQAAATAMLASLWKSYNLKELNLHVFPQGHALYLYKSFQLIESEVAARAAYYAKGKYLRPKKLFQNERLDIQLQFEPTPEEVAQMEEDRERRKQGLPPLDNSAKIVLEEEAPTEEEEASLKVPIQRFLVL